MIKQKITPFLWFDNNAEEAANFYTSIFKNSKINNITRSNGAVLVVSFELEGLQFTGLNGGPAQKFTEAVSFVVNCETQEEVDHYWDALLKDGGVPSVCSWLKDKYGLSWQIVPEILMRYLADKDPAKAGRVMQAMMGMSKIIIADLQKAYDG